MRIRAPSPSLDHTLLARLSPLLNSSGARNELRWMKQALARTHPPPPANSCLESMITRRVSGEPLQYILGTQPFGPLELLTRPPVLIPRPETEDWALRLARALRPAADSSRARVLDLCTGSGCVGLLLAKLWPRGTARVLGLDISPDALQLATDNAREAGIPSSVDASKAPLFQVDHPEENTFDAVYGDLRDPDALRRALLPHRRFALLTANPPYIPPSAMSSLDPSVRAFEDTRALVGTDNDGLGFYRSIAALVQPAANRDEILAETAVVALEVGHGQARAVQEIVHRSRALDGTDIWLDPWGVERVVVGWRGRDDDVREELKRKLGAEAGPWK